MNTGRPLSLCIADVVIVEMIFIRLNTWEYELLLCVVCCLLFVVCCLLFVVCVQLKLTYDGFDDALKKKK